MARAMNEIGVILNALQAIYMRHTDSHGIPHRPYGNDLVTFERYMGRLLVLRGVVSESAPYRFSEDPWTMYMREFGPISSRSREPYMSTSNVPRGILQSSGPSGSRTTFLTRQPCPNTCPSAPMTRHPNQTIPPSNYSVPANPTPPGCRVRFAADIPSRPQRGNGFRHTRHASPIPRWVN